MKKRSLRADVATYVVLSIAAILTIFPLLWVALTSLKNNRDAMAGAEHALDFAPTLNNYATVFSSPTFLSSLATSASITTASTFLTVIMATMGGYAFARLKFGGRTLLASVMVVVQIIPGIVLAIPLFRIVSALGMYDQWLPIILIMTGLSIPFATWVMLAFFQSTPIEIEEAALVDGASRLQLFRYILVPMVAPGMATAGIFTAIDVWNAYLTPLVLGQTRAETLTVYAAQFITFQDIEWGPLCATAVLILAPIVLFVLSMQRPLVKGLTAGSVR